MNLFDALDAGPGEVDRHDAALDRASRRTTSTAARWRSRIGASGPGDPRLRGDLGERAVLHRLDDPGRDLRVLRRLEERHDRGAPAPRAGPRSPGVGKRAASMTSAQRTRSARSSARQPKPLGERAGDEAGAARRGRDPRTSARSRRARRRRGRRGWGRRSRDDRTTSEARGEAEKRKSTQAFTSPSKASGGNGSPCWWCSGTKRTASSASALALDEEAREERRRGAAVEAVAVVEDLELHRGAGNLVTSGA